MYSCQLTGGYPESNIFFSSFFGNQILFGLNVDDALVFIHPFGGIRGGLRLDTGVLLYLIYKDQGEGLDPYGS